MSIGEIGNKNLIELTKLVFSQKYDFIAEPQKIKGKY